MSTAQDAEITPDTETIRALCMWGPPTGPDYRHEAGQRFDRWLAVHDAEVREQIAATVEAECIDHDPHSMYECRHDIAAEIRQPAAVVVGGKPQEGENDAEQA